MTLWQHRVTQREFVNDRCPSQRCDLQDIFDAFYDATKDQPFALVDYFWFDPITSDEVLKRTIVYRHSDAVVICAGFTVEPATSPPHWPIISLVSFVYVIYAGVAFILPGQMALRSISGLMHQAYIPEQTGAEEGKQWRFPALERACRAVPIQVWEAFPGTLLIVLVFLGFGLVAMLHLHTIEENSVWSMDQLLEQGLVTREVAYTLAGLALAMMFLAETLPEEKKGVTPALLMCCLTSMLASIDLLGAESENKENIEAQLHVQSALLTCSVVSCYWLFLYLTFSGSMQDDQLD